MIITTVVALIAGYALSRFSIPGRNTIVYAIVFVTGLPILAIVIPTYDIFVTYNLVKLPALDDPVPHGHVAAVRGLAGQELHRHGAAGTGGGRRDRGGERLRRRHPRLTRRRSCRRATAARNVFPVVIVFALLAALSNAISVTTRHVASVADPHRSAGWRLIIYLLRNPVWLLGWGAQAAAFVFQALALSNGKVSVVQPLLVIELVLTLVLRRVWIHQTIRPAAWSGGGLTCLGLAVFLVASEPQGGQQNPTSSHWAAAIIGCAAVVAALMAAGRFTGAGLRAALWASAAATAWALVAVFIKSTTDTITQFGVAGMFTHWPVYALAVGGLTGVLLEQWALQAGPLRVSQPFLVIVDPLVSIVLSIWLFGEHFVPDALSVTVAVLAFAVMCGGVVLLTQTAPATMEPAAVD